MKAKVRRLRACRCRVAKEPELQTLLWTVIAEERSRPGQTGIRTVKIVRCQSCDATWRTGAAYAAKLQRIRP